MSIEVPESISSREHERTKEVHTFVVFDLDRTLLQSDDLTSVLIEHMDTSLDMLPEDGNAREFIAKQRGSSFDALGYLSLRYSTEATEAAKRYVVGMAGMGMLDTLLYPEAPAAFDELEAQGIPYGILTYGKKETQEFKLSLLHAIIGKPSGEVSAKVTEEKFKAQWIESHWKAGEKLPDDEEWFIVHPDLSPHFTILAKNVVVVDDKAENTQAEDPRIVEFVVNNSETDPAAQQQPIGRFVRLLREGDFRDWVDKKVQRKLGMSA